MGLESYSMLTALPVFVKFRYVCAERKYIGLIRCTTSYHLRISPYDQFINKIY